MRDTTYNELFKGKRIDNGEWVEGSLLLSDGAVRIDRGVLSDCWIAPRFSDIKDYVKGSHVLALVDAIQVDQDTVCEYTGQTDKNREAIYEGDIVEAADFTAEDGYGEIIWDKETSRFAIVGRSGNDLYADFDNYYGKELEVIGNIFDNPELVPEP